MTYADYSGCGFAEPAMEAFFQSVPVALLAVRQGQSPQIIPNQAFTLSYPFFHTGQSSSRETLYSCFDHPEAVLDFLVQSLEGPAGEEDRRAVLSTGFGQQGGSRFPVSLRLISRLTAERADPVAIFSLERQDGKEMDAIRRCWNANEAICYITNIKGELIAFNHSFAEMSGRDADQLRGRSIENLDLPEPFAELFSFHVEEVLQSGRTFTARMSGPDPSTGQERMYSNKLSPDFGPGGVPQGLFGICRDVTLSAVVEDNFRNQGKLLQAANEAAVILFSDDDELDQVVNKVLGLIGEVTGSEQVDVWRNHESSALGLLATQIHCWSSSEAGGPSYYADTLRYSSELPVDLPKLRAGASLHWKNPGMSEEAGTWLKGHGLSAALIIPILFQSEFWGFVRLGTSLEDTPWKGGEEAVLRSVGSLLAATIQRRQIQEALAGSEQRFRDVITASGDIVWELDASGNFSYVSDRIFPVTGFRAEDVLGRNWESLTPDTEGITGRMFQDSIHTGSFQDLEHVIRSRGGEEIWLQTSGTLLLGQDGIAGLRGTSHDITKSRQTAQNLRSTLDALEVVNAELEDSVRKTRMLADEAEAASRAKSEFLTNVSHEIRTPLNAIVGLNYLLRKTDLSETQREYLEKIHSAGLALQEVINNIFDFSNLESKQVVIESQPYSLEGVFNHLASVHGPKAARKGLRLRISADHKVPLEYVGDPLRLEQVLGHLLDNAIKFTNHGEASLRCSLERRLNGIAFLCFLIEDTGIGIAEDKRSRLFESFSQGDASSTRKYGGTGLGLAIAKKLTDLSGGSLQVESQEGTGTKVFLRLPLSLDPARKADETGDSFERAASKTACQGMEIDIRPDWPGGEQSGGQKEDHDALERLEELLSLENRGEGISGIRLNDALDTHAEDRPLLLGALLRFQRDYSRHAPIILAMLENGELDEALEKVRAIRAQAGALGARSLLEAAKRLESLLEEGQKADDREQMAFALEFSRFMEFLRSNFHDRPKRQGEERAAEGSALLKASLIQVKALLRDDDASACTLYASIKEELEKMDPRRTAAASKALARFDLPEALAILDEVEIDG